MEEPVPVDSDIEPTVDLGSAIEQCEFEAETESGYSGDCSGSATTAPTPASLLSVLRPPPPSHLARRRKLNTLPPSGRKRSRGCTATAPKSVSPLDRVKEYPEESLSVSNNKLFCSACREELSSKKSSLLNHFESNKHQMGKERLRLGEKRERDIYKSLQDYDRRVHPSGETLPESTRVYRVKVVTSLLKAGIPLYKVDSLRDILEEHAFSLSASTNLRQLVPFVLENEISQLKRSIYGKHVGVIFDGTTHVCEAFVVLLRYIDDDWVIRQKVCRMMLLAKSLTGEEVARQLITCLSTELSILQHLVVSVMRDRASVNDVAMRTIGVLYSLMIEVGCFSHTLDHVGEHMVTPILDDFTKAWISLFSHSPKSRLAWKNHDSATYSFIFCHPLVESIRSHTSDS